MATRSAALDYRFEWKGKETALFLLVYGVIMGLMWGLGDDVPRFILYNITGFLTLHFAFVALHRGTVEVDITAKTATESRRWFGLRLVPKSFDLRELTAMELSSWQLRYTEMSPQDNWHAGKGPRVYRAKALFRNGKSLVVYEDFEASATQLRARLWSRTFNIAVQDDNGLRVEACLNDQPSPERREI